MDLDELCMMGEKRASAPERSASPYEKPPGSTTTSVPLGSAVSLCQTEATSTPNTFRATWTASSSQLEPGNVTTAIFKRTDYASSTWKSSITVFASSCSPI